MKNKVQRARTVKDVDRFILMSSQLYICSQSELFCVRAHLLCFLVMNHSVNSPALFGRLTCVCVCGRACLRLLSLGLLLNINKDFLPTRQSQTPDHLPGRTCPRIPQSWQASATNKDRPVFFNWPSIKMFTRRTSTHKSCFLSGLHP